MAAIRQAPLVVLFGRAGIPATGSIRVARAGAKLGQTRDFAARHDADGGIVVVGMVGADFAFAPRHDAFGRRHGGVWTTHGKAVNRVGIAKRALGTGFAAWTAFGGPVEWIRTVRTERVDPETISRVDAPLRSTRTRRSGEHRELGTATTWTDGPLLTQGNGLIARSGASKIHLGLVLLVGGTFGRDIRQSTAQLRDRPSRGQQQGGGEQNRQSSTAHHDIENDC
jgi:hypothetical protein